ncbi:MAG TPA: hypothetical protein VFS97_07500 [Nitrososphaeraceae archaeon]|nr:hypothetical protein [Nitrososphaeraceae archaeon]
MSRELTIVWGGDCATLEVTKANDVKKPEIKPNPPSLKILKVGGKEIKN